MSFYLLNMAGILIQLYPCAVLCFLPFPEESLRVSRRTLIVGSFIAALGVAVLFPFALRGCLILFERFPSLGTYAVADLLYLLAGIACCAAFMILVREPAVKKVLVLTIVLFYAAAQFWLVNLLIPVTPLSSEGDAYSVCGVVLYFATMLVLMPVVAVWVMRPVAVFLREVEPDEMKHEFRTAIAVTIVILCVMIYSDVAINYFEPVERASLFCVLFLFLIATTCMIYRLIFRDTLQHRREDERRRAMEIERLQLDKITREIEETRRMRHDMRHHLNTLWEILEEDRPDKAKAYLRELLGNTSQQENVVYCLDFTMNALLQYYVGRARNEGISCEVHADCSELTIPPADLTVIVGNIMENAIRACQKFPRDEDRWIRIRIGLIRSSLIMEICNHCQGVFLSHRYQTQSGLLPAEAFLSERPNGGLGLRSMSFTAEKYGGEALFCFDDQTETFITRIRLNLHMELLHSAQSAAAR